MLRRPLSTSSPSVLLPTTPSGSLSEVSSLPHGQALQRPFPTPPASGPQAAGLVSFVFNSFSSAQGEVLEDSAILLRIQQRRVWREWTKCVRSNGITIQRHPTELGVTLLLLFPVCLLRLVKGVGGQGWVKDESSVWIPTTRVRHELCSC